VTIAEILHLLEANPELQLIAGGTEIVGAQSSRSLDFPRQVASISKVQELRKTMRTEQFLEVGACSTLTGLLGLSAGNLQPPLPEVIATIGNHAVRNTATIGGNLCSRNRFMDLWPFLACMDAQVELRSSQGSRWASVSHLKGKDDSPFLPPATLLSRIRLPLRSFEFLFWRKLGRPGFPMDSTANFVCMATRERGKIEEFRLAFAGRKAFRNRDLELSLSGRKAGMPEKELRGLVAAWAESFSAVDWFDRRYFIALLEEAFERLFT
jgi:CO/xanthine dehydrogenase FAD-binding subunit